MTDREALTDSSNYADYLTLVHSDSFDKDDVNDKGSNNGEQTDDNLESNGEWTYRSSHKTYN